MYNPPHVCVAHWLVATVCISSIPSHSVCRVLRRGELFAGGTAQQKRQSLDGAGVAKSPRRGPNQRNWVEMKYWTLSRAGYGHGGDHTALLWTCSFHLLTTIRTAQRHFVVLCSYQCVLTVLYPICMQKGQHVCVCVPVPLVIIVS